MGKDDVRLSGPTLKVLKFMLVAPRQARSGAEISRETRVGSGTMYPLLARLETAGWFKSTWEDLDPREAGRPRRRLYTLTPLGQTKANDALADFQMPIGRLAWNS